MSGFYISKIRHLHKIFNVRRRRVAGKIKPSH
ncbi:hypothetical protein VP277E431_P0068 [Vibrio phage 277E43-1]|nr:hypothetical protein VP277E431_P0068 [Vibrio phage 277E43-1]